MMDGDDGIVVCDDIIDNKGDIALVAFSTDGPNYRTSPKGLVEIRCFIGWGSGRFNSDGYITWVPVFTDWFGE